MTETRPPEGGDTGGDPLRQHAEDPAEGPDPADAATPTEPREHPEDPAEG